MFCLGDITNTGNGKGNCIYDLLYGEKENKYFKDEFSEDLQHNKKGLLSMLNIGKNSINTICLHLKNS